MASYLLRNRYGNYYTRVPFPLKLKQLGFPHEFRISLLTKDRAIASFRNLMAAHSIKSLIEGFRVNAELLNKIRLKCEEIRAYDRMEPQIEALRKEIQKMQLERNLAVKEAKTLRTQLVETQNHGKPPTEDVRYSGEKNLRPATSCSLLKENDILMILGKGHEDYQIIGTEKIHFSDQEEVEKYIKEHQDD